MEPLEQRISTLEKKIDAMNIVVNKLYKVFLATVIITVIAFVLPMIGLLFAIPSFLRNYNSMLGL
jgi:hypothetical protein